jgi:hypothetical protein
MILFLDISLIMGLPMRRLRTSVLCALGAALLGAAVAAGPADAASAADTITIIAAGSPAAQVGELSVVADSTTPITSLTVHVLSSGQDVLDPAMTEQSQTPTADGYQSTWTVTDPIAEGTSPTGLPVGVYAVSVDATDGGTSVTGVDAGTLYFIDEPTLTIGPASPPTVSFDSPTATVSGQVTMLAPDGTVSDYQGTIALVPSWQSGTIPVTTDANGDYQATVSPTGTGDYLSAQISTARGVVASANVSFNVQVDAVAVKAHLSSSTVTYHAADSVIGTATYQPAPGAAYKPLPNQKVAVSNGQDPAAPAVTGVTDADGNFKIALPTTQFTTWQVTVGGDDGIFLASASVGLNMNVNLTTVVTGFHVRLNQYWQLSFGGCLGLTQPVSNAYLYLSPGPVIQWASTSKGPWHTLKRIETGADACGHDGAAFSGTATAPVNYAYYRAYYPGSATVYQTYGYASTTSSSVLAWKYDDRITSFSVSARVVNAGHDLTVKGQLQYWYSGWHNYRNQQILILLRPKGSSTWYWIVKVKTNASGHFSATFTDPVSATWGASFAGNSTHLSVGSATVYVRLRGTASAVPRLPARGLHIQPLPTSL